MVIFHSYVYVKLPEGIGIVCFPCPENVLVALLALLTLPAREGGAELVCLDRAKIHPVARLQLLQLFDSSNQMSFNSLIMFSQAT
jgi:hypothetical protein